MRDIKEFSNLPCYRHCWLCKTSYRTKISLIDIEKYYFLFLPVTKMSSNIHIARPLERFTLRDNKSKTAKNHGEKF